jgi:hypothetical protein
MSDIIDYSKLDRKTIDFLIEEIKRERPKNLNSDIRLGMDKSIRILNHYWRKSFESENQK